PVLAPPIRSTQDVQQHLSLSRFHEELAPIYETVRLLSRALPPDVTLVGYSGAPWTVATYMVEGRGGGASAHAIVKQWAMIDPNSFQSLIDLLTRAAIEYLDRQIEAGAEALQLFDSWAGILPEPCFRRWCVQPVAVIIEAIKARHPSIPIIAFPRAAGLLYNGYAEATKADCIGLDTTVPLGWAVENVQRKLNRCIQGNLDPVALVAGGKAMRDEIERILRVASNGPFVFNLGHGILKTTPPEHVKTLVKQVQAWCA
ncbi:MAG: uroporphyrinogen decarboxylase, partial [Acidisphaera sp.]|nr:uroporphyrinogen decarboxylase [Acidisphaera sp.]